MIGVAAGGYLVDRLAKGWALATLDPTNPVSLLGGLVHFRLVFNSGAAFSMGENLTVILSVFALMATVFVLTWVWPRVRTMSQAVTAGLLVAGITGNLTDRLIRPPGPLRGEVVDFIALPHFAIFNVADMCITFAAGLFIVLAIIDERSAGDQHRTATVESGESGTGTATEVEQP